MKAIIMAGGEGSRLRPLTCTMPKPMAHVMNRPLMEHILKLLRHHGITEIGVTLMYMPESIRDYFGDGKKWGVRLTYFCEDTPLGTAGCVKNAESFLDDDFLVISGDALCDTDLTAAIAFHRQKNAEATLVLRRMDIPLAYGVVVTDSDGRVQRFLEKPSWSQVFSDMVNTGIYILRPSVLQLVEKTPCDFSKDVFPRLLETKRPLYGFAAEGYWCDIGDLDAYRHCHYDVFEKRIRLEKNAHMLSPGIYAEEGTVIEDGAIVRPPALLGKNVYIRSGAVIDGYTVIGNGSLIESGASVKRSVIYDGVIVGKNTQIRGSVLCSGCIVRENASLFEQSVIGAGSSIGEDTVIKPGVKIWPCKAVGRHEIISSNLVWGAARAAGLFGERGISGQMNADLHPAFAQKIGAAVGTLFPAARIGIADDGSAAGLMLKFAAASGLLSTGAFVYDFGTQPLPVTRSGIKVYGLSAGIQLSVHGDVGYIDIMDCQGANVSAETERKLENLFTRGDFTHVAPEKIPKMTPLYDYKQSYLQQLLSSVSRGANMRIAISASSAPGRQLLQAAAGALGCTFLIENVKITAADTDRLRRFAESVPARGCAFGAVLDDACESVLLIDARGRIVSPDLYKILVPLLVMRKYNHARIAVNLSASGAVDILAARYGAQVQRTKESPIALMDGLSGHAPDKEEQFILYFDGMGAIIRIADFLQKQGITLAALLDEIPSFCIIRREIDCTPGNKGRLIRTLAQTHTDAETTDGVKIRDKNGWVLILPDGQKPTCRLIAHADNEEYAQALTDMYDEKIRDILSANKQEHAETPADESVGSEGNRTVPN